MKKLLLTLFTIGLILALHSPAAAQPPPPPDKPDQAPLDGGLALLALAGGGYAVKKLRDKNTN